MRDLAKSLRSEKKQRAQPRKLAPTSLTIAFSVIPSPPPRTPFFSSSRPPHPHLLVFITVLYHVDGCKSTALAGWISFSLSLTFFFLSPEKLLTFFYFSFIHFHFHTTEHAAHYRYNFRSHEARGASVKLQTPPHFFFFLKMCLWK